MLGNRVRGLERCFLETPGDNSFQLVSLRNRLQVGWVKLGAHDHPHNSAAGNEATYSGSSCS
jgi:hypothetical protein